MFYYHVQIIPGASQLFVWWIPGESTWSMKLNMHLHLVLFLGVSSKQFGEKPLLALLCLPAWNSSAFNIFMFMKFCIRDFYKNLIPFLVSQAKNITLYMKTYTHLRQYFAIYEISTGNTISCLVQDSKKIQQIQRCQRNSWSKFWTWCTISCLKNKRLLWLHWMAFFIIVMLCSLCGW